MTDLIVVSLEAWDAVWRRNQHLVAGLLRRNAVDRVLFVEPAADPIHALRRRRWPTPGTGLRAVNDESNVGADRLWAYQPSKWLPRIVDARADRRWATRVRNHAADLGMHKPILWVNDPIGADLMHATKWPTLYDITDDWLVADRPSRQRRRLQQQETALLAESREVVVCSRDLRASKSATRKVTLISNAVDLEPYRVLQPRPSDLPPGPLALYLGTAHRDRIDIDLCVATANRLADQSGGEKGRVVLVGPAPLPSRDLSRLRDAGVYLLGPRPMQQVPAYLQHADVLIVPHVLTDFTASLDPIKAYEYRAAGRSVVATPVPGFSEATESHIHSVPAESFPEMVSTTLKSITPWTLPTKALAATPSWSDRASQMAAVIAQLSTR